MKATFNDFLVENPTCIRFDNNQDAIKLFELLSEDENIISMIEYADFRQHTLKILDVFNKYFGVAISDKNKRKKYVQMTKEIFSDSNYSNNSEKSLLLFTV